jgi:AraC-like DNA-binding protein
MIGQDPHSRMKGGSVNQEREFDHRFSPFISFIQASPSVGLGDESIRLEQIYIISNNINLYDQLRHQLAAKRSVPRLSPGAISAFDPNLAIIGCDLNCQIRACARSFVYSTFFKFILFARPIRMQQLSKSEVGYMLASAKPNGGSYFRKIFRTSLKDGIELDFFALQANQQNRKILAAQEEVIRCRGKLSRVPALGARLEMSAAALSEGFRRAVGWGIKGYINKIRLCHSLFDIVSDDKRIKTIALDYGYRPEAFSRIFRRKYGVWPTSIRGELNDFALEEKSNRLEIGELPKSPKKGELRMFKRHHRVHD